MPGKEEEGQEIMRWLGHNISKDIFVNIREQYHPDAYVGRSSKSLPPPSIVESIERHPTNELRGGPPSVMYAR